jgi:hypothetical protein
VAAILIFISRMLSCRADWGYTTKAIQTTQQRYERDGGRTMTSLPLSSIHGVSAEVVLSICGKLLGCGLIVDPEQRAVSLGLGSYPRGGGYMVLKRGQRFLKFIEEVPAALQTQRGLQ